MKRFVISTISSIILLSSCTTNVVNQRKAYNDSKLKLGKNYIFTTQDGKKYSLKISKIDSLTVYGKDSEENLITIEKSKIFTIKKHNVAGTVGIVVGGIAAAVVIPAYISNKPVGQ
ncbi:hypothetical protein ACL0VS_11015 [Chryseobacterium sp. PMSZPI]|uniref:hypothetical protein n=1 Tax=Chryseobacterium sp. PMSZPI TaxID=1033900 RepID=UPI0039A0EE29